MGGIKYYQLSKGEEIPDEFCVVKDVNGEPSEYMFYVPEAENVKLRELVKCLVRCSKGLSCDECTFGDVRDVTVCGVLMYAARLGIEVDG